MTAFATANRVDLKYIKEVTFGTTPASTPALSAVRFTGESINYGLKNIRSAEIRSDRNVANLIQTESDVTGDVNFELSYTSFDDWIESALSGAWSSNVLKNGVVQSSYTLQKHFNDPTTPFYMNYTGMRVGTMELNFQTGQILTGKFGFMGLAGATTTSQFTGATTPAATTTDPMNCVSNVTAIKENGSPTTNFFSKLSISLTNNLRAQKAIGSLANVGIAYGTMDITGSIDLYLQNKTFMDRYLAGTAFSLEFDVTDAVANSYTIKLPKVKLETGQMVAGGLDQDVMISGTWRAIYDVGTSCMIEIDRAP